MQDLPQSRPPFGIELRDLTFSYSRRGHPALSGLRAQCSTGAIALLGPNGAGKSTLFSILSTVRRPDSGSFVVGDCELPNSSRVDEYRKLLGVVPQRFKANPGYTCQEVLHYVAWLRRVDRREISERVADALAAVNLSPNRDQRVKTLSGGMLQRLALAQALVGSPRILLLDEPTVGLDPEQRYDLLANLKAVAATTTVVLATHLVEDVAAFAREVIVLDKGSVRFCGDVFSFSGVTRGQTLRGEHVERAYLRLVGAGSRA